MRFEELIRVVPDFPSPGISFKDITTLLKDGPAFRQAVDALAEQFRGEAIDLVAGPEARGFVIGAPLAYSLGVGFVPVRKPGKLPAEVLHYEYSLEYGVDALEVHRDAIRPGQKVLIIDDLLATGGTTKAVIAMVEQLGGEVVGLGFLLELSFLQGRIGLEGYKVKSLVQY